MSERTPPFVIGWTEYVDLPDWEVRGLRAKVDTGARTSALHVEGIRLLSRERVAFDVVLHRKKRDRRIHVRTRIRRRGVVRSSTGERSQRIFVSTLLRLGPLEKEIEISLVDRKQMIHRMLLGREALSGPIRIDVNHRSLLGKRRRRKRRRPVAP